MKATLSIAVLALLGRISAMDVNAAMSAPTAEALVQTGSHHHKRHHRVKGKKLRDEIEGELAPSDHNTAYDPDVADAPEDMTREGNDHNEYHNAKLSPEGYYDGFFHKDFEGNYAQQRQRHHKQSRRTKYHRGRYPRYVQVNDHKKDTDDIVVSDADAELFQQKFNHENDTDDVVEEYSDVQSRYQHEGDTDDVVEEFSEIKDARGSAVDRINTLQNANQEKLYEFVQHDLIEDHMDVQIGESDHDNDTEDIPEGFDPLSLAKHKKGEPFKTIGELMQERADFHAQADVDEIASMQ